MGEVNLEDVTDEVRAHDFQVRTRRCRRLSNAVADDFAADTLRRKAEEYEAKAAKLLGDQRFANSDGDRDGIYQPPDGMVVDGPDTVADPRV